MIALSTISTIVINVYMRAVNIQLIEGRSKKIFLNWLPWILCIRLPKSFGQNKQVSSVKEDTVISLNVNQSGQNDPIANIGRSSEEFVKQQWIFVAIVVDRLCLIISFTFTLISVTVFLICAF